jgi:hypothetical protein
MSDGLESPPSDELGRWIDPQGLTQQLLQGEDQLALQRDEFWGIFHSEDRSFSSGNYTF